MKIVNFDELVKLPKGTIYSDYEPCVCDGLFRFESVIEYEGGPKDFFYTSLIGQCDNGEAPVVDDVMSRWGLFDYNAQFAVYEKADLTLIKSMISAAQHLP